MTYTQFILGPMGRLFASACIMITLSLIVIMSVRLMLSRRKQAYYTLTLSLSLMIASYSASLFLLGKHDSTNEVIIQALQMFAFLFGNMALYQMYNPTRRLQRFLFGFALLLSAGLVACIAYTQSTLSPDNAQAAQLAELVLQLYMASIIFVCFMFIPPYIGQPHKYQIGLTAFFIAHGAHMVNRHVAGGESVLLATAQHLMPLVYFFMLFAIVFDRVLELMQAVYRSSITDGLTGLFNRTYFNRQAKRYLESNWRIAIIFTDIDNFKKLNDTQGHQKGDEALKRVATIMNEEAEDIGIAGRYGGEEIVMLITEHGVKPDTVAERIRSRIESEAGVTVSVGYSKSRKGITAEQLMKEADEAMYVSKTTGKNKVTGYSAKALQMLTP